MTVYFWIATNCNYHYPLFYKCIVFKINDYIQNPNINFIPIPKCKIWIHDMIMQSSRSTGCCCNERETEMPRSVVCHSLSICHWNVPHWCRDFLLSVFIFHRGLDANYCHWLMKIFEMASPMEVVKPIGDSSCILEGNLATHVSQ